MWSVVGYVGNVEGRDRPPRMETGGKNTDRLAAYFYTGRKYVENVAELDIPRMEIPGIQLTDVKFILHSVLECLNSWHYFVNCKSSHGRII